MQTSLAIKVPRLLRSESQPIALRILVLLLFVAVVFLSGWRVVRILHHPGDIPEFRQGLTDFHHIFVFPAMAARDGVNPYAPEFMEHMSVNRQYPLYSPATFWLAYPLTFVPLAVADAIYFSLTVILVIALAASALYVCRLPRTFVNVIGLATLVLVSRPGHVNLLAGQPTLLIVLGAVWALELARRRPNWAGVALAVTTLKPTFGVPFVWLMFCRRDFRAVIVGVVLTVATIAVGLAPFIARDGFHSVLISLKEGQAQHEADPTVSAQSTWTRLDGHALLGKLSPTRPNNAFNLVFTAAILLSAGWLLWRTRQGPLTEGADNLASLLICTTTLICIYHATYDALLLVVPWMGVAFGRLGEQVLPRSRILLFVLLSVPAVNYVSSQTFLRRFEIDGPLWTAITSLNGAAIAGAFALTCYCLYFKRVTVVRELAVNPSALSTSRS